MFFFFNEIACPYRSDVSRPALVFSTNRVYMYRNLRKTRFIKLYSEVMYVLKRCKLFQGLKENHGDFVQIN